MAMSSGEFHTTPRLQQDSTMQREPASEPAMSHFQFFWDGDVSCLCFSLFEFEIRVRSKVISSCVDVMLGHNVDQVHVEQGPRQPAEFPEQLLVICDIVRGVAFHPQVVNLFFATNTILHFDQALLKCDGSNGADVLRDRSQPTLGRNKRIFLVLDFSESSKLHCKRHFVSFIKAFWSVQQVLFRADNAH